jgi:hypothetical protein
VKALDSCCAIYEGGTYHLQGSLGSKSSFTYVDAILIQPYLSKSHGENKKIF